MLYSGRINIDDDFKANPQFKFIRATANTSIQIPVTPVRSSMGGHSSKQKNSYKVAPVASQSQTTRSAAPVTVAASESVPTTTVVPKVDDTSKAETAASPPPPVPVDSRLVPNWINETQFVEILRESVPKFAKIRSYNVKPGLGAGENYATLMLRVSIEAELEGEQK